MLKNEFKKNKVIYITICIFVILAAMLMTIGSIVVMQTADSMQSLFEVAEPPHFLQMHIGDINQQEIDEFSKQDKRVVANEIVEMINVDAAGIWYQHSNDSDSKSVSMSGNMMDNGFVRQNKELDFLVDENNEVIQQKDGQIGIPISYKSKYDLEIGDTLTISLDSFYKEYKIAQFVRDAQMASTMASSTRFLMSDADYEELKNAIREIEYIVEYRFDDSRYASDFQKKYQEDSSNMPKNGQAITYPLIKMVNGLSSGLTAAMMVLISILLIVIAVFVLKYTILAALEEEVYEIGVLKAIGISNKDIELQYLLKYRVIGVFGCIAGYVLGLFVSRLFTGNIQMMFGCSDMGYSEILTAFVMTFVVYIMIISKTRKILKRIRKVTVVQAIVHGEMSEQKTKKNMANTFSLLKYCKKHVNVYLGFKELLTEKKMWLLVTFIFMLAVNVILNPLNLVNTFKSPKFSEYMGTANGDVEIIIQAKEDIERKYNDVKNTIGSDSRIDYFSVYDISKYNVEGVDGQESIQIERGEYKHFSTKCIEGKMPEKDGEIALSYLNMKKLGKNVGDIITVYKDNAGHDYRVCGVYQDITSGGYTAKMYAEKLGDCAQHYMILFNCKNADEIKKVASDYDKQFDFVKSLPMEEYVSQTFGSVIDSFEKAVFGIIFVAVIIILLVMILFLKLHGAKHQKSFVMYQILGFNEMDKQKQYLVKTGVAALLGLVIGVITNYTLGAALIGRLLSLAGISIVGFKYISNIWVNVLICPVCLIVFGLIITSLYIRCTRKEADVRLMQE